MSDFQIPEPVLNVREEDLLHKITEDYNNFASPGPITKGMSKVRAGVGKIIPESVKSRTKRTGQKVAETKYIQKAAEIAAKGFVELTKHASRFTTNPDNVVIALNENGCELDNYQQVCAIRSYHIEPLVTHNYRDRALALAEGAATGAPGFLGIPFNLAISFFLYFRATQNIALHYGYDIQNDPRELEIASEVTMTSLAPNVEQGTSALGGYISKMMFAANATALRESLKKLTYEEMAKKGGTELVYVQIRALANKAAKKALDRAGKEGIEAGVYRKMLEQIGKRMPQRAGQRAIPFIGGIVGGLTDTYYMSRVLRGGNMVYHKRFLMEKEERLRVLCGDGETK